MYDCYINEKNAFKIVKMLIPIPNLKHQDISINKLQYFIRKFTFYLDIQITILIIINEIQRANHKRRM